MRVVIRLDAPFWARSNRRPKNQKALAARQERIRDLMLLALETPAGKMYDGHPDLVSSVRQDSSPESLLDRFPIVSRDNYFFDRNQFLNPESGEAGFQRFEYPLTPLPRTAILMEGFIETEKVMCFPEGWSKDLADFRAECLAGPVSMLRRMAASVFNRGAHFPSMRRPIVAFTGLPFGDAGVLTDADRNQLWKAFNQPVYEYFLGHSQEVLAQECYARQGLHVDLAQAVFEMDAMTSELIVTSMANTVFPVVRLATGLCGTVIEGYRANGTGQPCACGFNGQRVMNIEALSTLKAKPRTRSAVAGSHLSVENQDHQNETGSHLSSGPLSDHFAT